MNESAKFEAQKKKLQGLCDEHHLVYSLEKNSYPITLTLRPTGETGGQMVMPEMTEEDARSPDATLVFSIEDGELDIKTSETFTISATLFDKLKNIYRKMHFFWLQFFFREVVEKDLLATEDMPVIDDSFLDDEDDDPEPPTVKTTVDGSGLVTNVDFSGESTDDEEEDDDYEYGEPDDDDEDAADPDDEDAEG